MNFLPSWGFDLQNLTPKKSDSLSYQNTTNGNIDKQHAHHHTAVASALITPTSSCCSLPRTNAATFSPTGKLHNTTNIETLITLPSTCPQIRGYAGQPYQDHNYFQILPASDDERDCKNFLAASIHSSYPPIFQDNYKTSASHHSSNSHHLYHQQQQQPHQQQRYHQNQQYQQYLYHSDNSFKHNSVDFFDINNNINKNNHINSSNNTSNSLSNHNIHNNNNTNSNEEDYVTRCICDFQHDDGYMICCDLCGVWQHVDCMSVDRDNIPDCYMCELCQPRAIDRHKAIKIQTKKRDDLDALRVPIDTSETETEDETTQNSTCNNIHTKKADDGNNIFRNDKRAQSFNSKTHAHFNSEKKLLCKSQRDEKYKKNGWKFNKKNLPGRPQKVPKNKKKHKLVSSQQRNASAIISTNANSCHQTIASPTTHHNQPLHLQQQRLQQQPQLPPPQQQIHNGLHDILEAISQDELYQQQKQQQQQQQHQQRQQQNKMHLPAINSNGHPQTAATTTSIQQQQQQQQQHIIASTTSTTKTTATTTSSSASTTTNKYTPELQTLLSSIKFNNQLDSSHFFPPTGQSNHLNLCRVGLHNDKMVLEATEDIVTHLPLIEYVGNVMLRDQYMGSWQPHVLFYSKFGGVDLCVDATNIGNEARFVRRSCTPNAEIQHSLQGNNLRFFIHASKSIIAGAEITIAFDFNYHKCGFAVECACTRSSCPVLKFQRREHHQKNYSKVPSSSHAAGGAQVNGRTKSISTSTPSPSSSLNGSLHASFGSSFSSFGPSRVEFRECSSSISRAPPPPSRTVAATNVVSSPPSSSSSSSSTSPSSKHYFSSSTQLTTSITTATPPFHPTSSTPTSNSKHKHSYSFSSSSSSSPSPTYAKKNISPVNNSAKNFTSATTTITTATTTTHHQQQQQQHTLHSKTSQHRRSSENDHHNHNHHQQQQQSLSTSSCGNEEGKKKTREEKKLEAYVKAFERLEKKEERMKGVLARRENKRAAGRRGRKVAVAAATVPTEEKKIKEDVDLEADAAAVLASFSIGQNSEVAVESNRSLSNKHEDALLAAAVATIISSPPAAPQHCIQQQQTSSNSPQRRRSTGVSSQEPEDVLHEEKLEWEEDPDRYGIYKSYHRSKSQKKVCSQQQQLSSNVQEEEPAKELQYDQQQHSQEEGHQQRSSLYESISEVCLDAATALSLMSSSTSHFPQPLSSPTSSSPSTCCSNISSSSSSSMMHSSSPVTHMSNCLESSLSSSSSSFSSHHLNHHPVEISSPSLMMAEQEGKGCSAKKRWLNRAMIETPLSSSCDTDFVTPLKKRRMARESMLPGDTNNSSSSTVQLQHNSDNIDDNSSFQHLDSVEYVDDVFISNSKTDPYVTTAITYHVTLPSKMPSTTSAGPTTTSTTASVGPVYETISDDESELNEINKYHQPVPPAMVFSSLSSSSLLSPSPSSPLSKLNPYQLFKNINFLRLPAQANVVASSSSLSSSSSLIASVVTVPNQSSSISSLSSPSYGLPFMSNSSSTLPAMNIGQFISLNKDQLTNHPIASISQSTYANVNNFGNGANNIFKHVMSANTNQIFDNFIPLIINVLPSSSTVPPQPSTQPSFIQSSSSHSSVVQSSPSKSSVNVKNICNQTATTKSPALFTTNSDVENNSMAWTSNNASVNDNDTRNVGKHVASSMDSHNVYGFNHLSTYNNNSNNNNNNNNKNNMNTVNVNINDLQQTNSKNYNNISYNNLLNISNNNNSSSSSSSSSSNKLMGDSNKIEIEKLQAAVLNGAKLWPPDLFMQLTNSNLMVNLDRSCIAETNPPNISKYNNNNNDGSNNENSSNNNQSDMVGMSSSNLFIHSLPAVPSSTTNSFILPLAHHPQQQQQQLQLTATQHRQHLQQQQQLQHQQILRQQIENLFTQTSTTVVDKQI